MIKFYILNHIPSIKLSNCWLFSDWCMDISCLNYRRKRSSKVDRYAFWISGYWPVAWRVNSSAWAYHEKAPLLEYIFLVCLIAKNTVTHSLVARIKLFLVFVFVTPLLTHWSSVFLVLTHRYEYGLFNQTSRNMLDPLRVESIYIYIYIICIYHEPELDHHWACRWYST